MWYAILGVSIAVVGGLAFYAGRKLADTHTVQSKTTTFLIKSIQAIAELAVLEYRTEGVTEIKQQKAGFVTVCWKRGLLRYTAKLKVGFDLERLDCSVDDSRKSITISLPSPKVLSCEIYNRKFYKLPLEKAENISWKYDIIQDFSSDEVLALDDEARENALSNVNDLYVLDMLQDKTRMAFKRIVSLSYPDYTTEITIAGTSASTASPQLPPEQDHLARPERRNEIRSTKPEIRNESE
ncbi:MAG TPA: DUF4230 domain-containing protein [Sedimentisphaerales bacterium]|nr:DUF4230 domain-containing protein [Sedimentisphaerales bacterium]